MKFFSFIFNILILIIIVGGNITIIYFLDSIFGVGVESIEKYQSLILLLFIESIIVMIMVKSFYHTPIAQLKLLIQKFYVGQLKGKELSIKKGMNADINTMIDFFGKTLGTLKNIKAEFLHGKEIKEEVGIGKDIQEKMLSKKLLKIPSLNIVAKSKPADDIGGDSYDIIQQGDNYYVYVGDATGHGVGAGFIMMMVNALVNGFAKVLTSGADILVHTNEMIKPRVKANLLMSLLLVRWNEKDKRMYMTGAGHEFLMIYKYKQQKCFRIKSGGAALGMVKNVKKLIKERELSFEEKDIIILYSDGITEAINKGKRDGTEIMYGEDRLEKAIEGAPNVSGCDYKSANTVFNNISIELSKFMGYKPVQLDDITLVTIQYNTQDYDEKKDVTLDIPTDLMTDWTW